MKNIKKVTVTIGIPAYNEERNIAYLLRSIILQKQVSYTIASVIVACDGCTDNTVKRVKKFASRYSFITAIAHAKRTGKADALNLIYSLNKSDYLLTIDADLALLGDLCIENMVREAIKNNKLNLVGPRHIPVMPRTIMGKFAYYSYISFEDAFLKLNNGNNYYAMMAVALMPKRFAATVTYPKGTISDQCYLYAAATRKNKDAFKLVKNAAVLFSPVSTFIDWRILGVRSVIGDKEDVAKHFGQYVLQEFHMPKMLYVRSLIKWFIKSPFYMTGSVLMNMYIRSFPYNKQKPQDGMWTLAISSKIGIILDNL